MDDSQSSQEHDTIDTTETNENLCLSAKSALWPILRDRWAEATMVVVLNAGIMAWLQYLAWEMRRQERSTLEQISNLAGFFLGMGTMAYTIVTQMLLLGFMVSAVYEGVRRQEPLTLLLAGRFYFWRWIRFLILEAVFIIAITGIVVQVLNATVLHVQSLKEIPEWANIVSGIVGVMILTKLALIVPAEMIVRNQMVFESIRSMRDYSLVGMKTLVAVYLFVQGVMVWMSGWMPDTEKADWRSLAEWSGRAIWMSIGQFVILLWAILEVKAIRRPQSTTIAVDMSKENTE